MPNDYYNTTEIVPLTRGRSRVRNDEFNAVEDGFDLLPSLSDVFGGLATFAGDSTGSGNAYDVTMPKTRTSNADGEEVVFVANHTNTGAATLNVDTIGDVDIVDANGDALTAGVIESGLVYEVRYDATNTRFQMVGPGGNLAFLDTVDTGQIEDDAVTTVKIADLNVTTAKLAANAVTTAKITDLNVTTGKIAANAITSAKMGLDAGLTVAGGDVVMDAGEGLDLSANAGTAAAGAATTKEILDFYEEGTWTPAFSGSSGAPTYGIQAGFFERVGRRVTFNFAISITALDTLAGPISVTGLPYATTASADGSHSGGIATFVQNTNIPAGSVITGRIQHNGGQSIVLYKGQHATGDDYAQISITNSDLTNTTRIEMSGHYVIT